MDFIEISQELRAGQRCKDIVWSMLLNRGPSWSRILDNLRVRRFGLTIGHIGAYYPQDIVHANWSLGRYWRSSPGNDSTIRYARISLSPSLSPSISFPFLHLLLDGRASFLLTPLAQPKCNVIISPAASIEFGISNRYPNGQFSRRRVTIRLAISRIWIWNRRRKHRANI